LMNLAVPDCLVTNFKPLVARLTLPDQDDRHVLAAAIRSGAQVIVTANLKDFPESVLAAHGIEAQHPDEFVLNLLDLAPTVVAATIEEQAAALKSPPQTIAELLAKLRENGLVRTTKRVGELLTPT
jgi:hypothetical protein